MAVIFGSITIDNIADGINSSGGSRILIDGNFVTTSVTSPETINVYLGWRNPQGNGDINYVKGWTFSLSQTSTTVQRFDFNSINFDSDHLCSGVTISFYLKAVSTASTWVSDPYNLFLRAKYTLPSLNYMIGERSAQQDQEVYYNGTYRGEAGSCVANALCSAVEIFGIRSNSSALLNSVGWLYGATAEEEGFTYYNTALNFLRTNGAMPLTYVNAPSHMQRYPDNYFYDNTSSVLTGARTLFQNNNNTAYSRPQRISAWSQITQDAVFRWQNVFDAITNPNKVVLVALGLDSAFYDTPRNGHLPDGYGDWDGGHMMVVLGWKQYNGRMYFICQNSWGSWFGDDGLVYIPFTNIKTCADIHGYYTGIEAFYEITDDPNAPSFPTPPPWQWISTVSVGSPFMISAQEWRSFCDRINAFRAFKGLSAYSFSNVSSGQAVSATIVNQARTAINAVSTHGTLPPQIVSGDTITAYVFNQLRIALNAIT